nr:MAG: ORF1 [TTV-like mini virus]
MPPYWRPYWRNYRRKTYKRRRWVPRWRTRRFVQRRYRRRKSTKYYPRTKVKKFKFYKKAKKRTVKQFNPYKINKCKIVGYKCLFQGNKDRLSRNYIQYIYSVAPKHWPSGGGWSLIVFSLTSLFEDFEHLENIWTRSNAGLPLVQYQGVRLKFYQTEFTDYIVTYERCWPMVDTDLTHADLAPSRMIQKHHKITIPSRKTKHRRKPYKSIFIRPPAQMQTKWYFQRDICKIPLLMLSTTAVDLRFPFQYPDARNSTIRFQCLSTLLFQNPDFGAYPTTSGYSPKKNNGKPLYLYASHRENPTSWTKEYIGELIPLKNTKDFKEGTPIKNMQGQDKQDHWGNPFFYHYLTDETSADNYTIFITDATTVTILTWYQTATTGSTFTSNSITPVSGPILYECSYNPAKDTGSTNQAYIVSNTTSETWEPPTNENHIIEGLPLPIMLWGWIDWIIKLKQTVSPEKYQMIVIKSKVIDPELPYYVPLDYDFTAGFMPYTPDKYNQQHTIDTFSQQHWYPKILFQQQQIERICQSGPNVPRPIDNVYIQSFCKYKFYFKWGGCPKQLDKAYDPCLQPVWPTTDKLSGRVEISNPLQPPQTELYEWDWDEDYVKETAIQRIKQYTTTYPTTLLPTENKNAVPALKKIQEKDTEKTEEERLFEQLQQLRQQRKLLELQIHRQRIK